MSAFSAFTCFSAAHFAAYGEIFTWGGSYMGQAGTQSAARDYTVPTKVEKLDSDKEALPTFKFVTAGDYCSAAISSMLLFSQFSFSLL
jgi:hypothetical protein